MASISSLGAGSGLDLESLLSQLLAAESAPVENRLNIREANTQATISAFATYRGALADFQASFTSLADATNFNNRSAKSSDTSLFTATATTDAVLGSYDVNVINLATRQKLVSTDFTDSQTVIGTGTLAIAVGSSSFDVDITSGTLEDIAAAINGAANNTGITATIITVDDDLGSGTESRLVFTADESGSENEITITVTDDDLTNEDNSGLSQLFYQAGNGNSQLTEQRAAADAEITLDGFTVSSSTNTFSDAINGVTITALAESPDPINDPPSALTVQTNPAAITANVTAFVEAFNSLQDTVNALTEFDVDAGTSGSLNGDFTLRTLQSQTRNALNTSFNVVTSNVNNLVNLGITTAEDGKLSVDQTILNDAVNNQLEDVTAYFAGDSGLITRLDSLFDSYLQTGGLLQTREDGLNNNVEEIQDARIALDVRLDAVERRFRNQFAALDTLVASLNAQSSFLQQQLQNTSNIINSRSDSNN